MNNFKLSYVLTTFNKLPYLKEVMRLLLLNKKDDEEIVIADGGSRDGTKDYILNLHQQGFIEQFISEKDFGEAHGFNKAFLMARGELIKIITDDDVYNYVAIQKMKKFMLSNTEFDAITGNIISVNIMVSPTFLEFRKSYEIWFKKFTKGELDSCFFSCLPLMLRRDRIPLLGLLDTSYKHVDLEYSVRLTTHRRKVAFYTDIVAIGIVNNQSISASSEARALVEVALERLKGNYKFKDQRGVKSTSTPWIRSELIDKFSLAKKIANRFKLFHTQSEYYPYLDVNLKDITGIPGLTLERIFQIFENELKNVHESDYEFIHD